MIPILDWIFEGIVNWVASIVSQLFDAVSGLFLNTLGTDMTAMEEYFPFVTKAYSVMQVTAWALLILIVVWQLFRAFGGPITEAENPWHLVVRGAIFALLIGYAKPIFLTCLEIARAPYTSLMEISMTAEDFTFAGVEQALTNGLATLVAAASVVGLILILILEIALGWNYFKLLLETVERYIVVGVLCYTSPLAFSVGASKATNNVFRSWCRMVGSQLLLLVMNVWFLRGFASSMGHFIGNGGALSNGNGSIFLWMFCALAYLKCAQRFDSYLASIGMNVAQTGSSMAMEMMMAARVVSGAGNAARSAGSVFGRTGGNATATGTGAAANGFAASFASRFNPNSYVRDAVVDGGTRMGFSGGAGVVGRAFGGIAARNGATLNGDSISSVATRMPNASGAIAGDIADRSLGNYMPHMQGFQLQGTQISGGHISTTATTPDGKQASVDLWNASQFEKPEVPHSVITASDGSQWYQMASGDGRGAFYDAPVFHGAAADAAVSAAEDIPNATGPQVSSDSLTYDGMDTQPGVAQFPGGETIPATADMPEKDAMSGDSMVVPPDMGTFPASGDIPQSGGFQLGENGEMSPDANADSGIGIHPIGTAPDAAGTAFEGAQDGMHFAGAVSAQFPEGSSVGSSSESYGSAPQEAAQNVYAEAPLVAATFPAASEGTMLRTVGEGVIEASSPDGGNTLWYNSAFYQEPDAPHSTMEAANGVQWYAMQPHADAPQFETGDAAVSYNRAAFQNFMPGYEVPVSRVDGEHRQDGHFEVRHEDGSGTKFYDTARYAAPRGDYQVYEDAKGSQWYAIRGEAAVERKPVYENGKPVYDGEKLRTINVETVRYKQTPARFAEPEKRGDITRKPPRRKI